MLTINQKIFKAYDIRGIYEQDFDDEFAYLLGLAYVQMREKEISTENKKMIIAVGHDMRLSSPALKESLVRGLIEKGADVVDLGLISTPSFYFAVGKHQFNGGIMVSASHNPKEWNGFKLVREKGSPISGETGIEELKNLVTANKFDLSDKPGKIMLLPEVIEEELSFALEKTNLNNIKHLKVVADAANSMGATYLEFLFKSLPQCELVPMNFQLDGTFPAHEADPLKEENLEQLKKIVIEQQADLGISTDGDGDRIFFVDSSGKTINPAIIRGLLSKLFLKEKPGAKIGYDVRPGKITVDMIEASGGIPVTTRVGHSLIKEQMIKEDIYFAGESSGHFYLKAEYGCFEYPMIMILKLLEEFSATEQSTADYVSHFEKYYSSGEINREVKDKAVVFQKIKNSFSEGIINELDGVSVTFPDYWFNVRGSNTEEKVRLNLEAINQEIVEEKTKNILDIITS